MLNPLPVKTHLKGASDVPHNAPVEQELMKGRRVSSSRPSMPRCKRERSFRVHRKPKLVAMKNRMRCRPIKLSQGTVLEIYWNQTAIDRVGEKVRRLGFFSQKPVFKEPMHCR